MDLYEMLKHDPLTWHSHRLSMERREHIHIPEEFMFDREIEKREALAPTKAWQALKKVWVRRCTKENRNLQVIVTGPTGSGKSYAALRLAHELDKHFSINRVVFTPQDLLKIVRKDLPPASAIVLDEAQISADHKKWFDKTVQAIRYVVQTVRFKNHILIFTTPEAKFVEKDARGLFHVGIEMKDYIDYKKKLSEARIRVFEKMFWLSDSDLLTIKPRLDVGGVVHTLDKVWFKLPPKALREAYEKKKQEFADTLYYKLEQDLKELMKVHLDVEKIVQIVSEDPAKYLNDKGKLSVQKIQYEFGISRDKASMVKTIVEEKMRQRRRQLEKQLEQKVVEKPQKSTFKFAI